MNKARPLSAYAERLWLNLQSNLLDFHKTLIEIIESEAWKPTYETFTDAWTARMSNISFAQELLPHIAYQMFNEGRTTNEITEVVQGIGPEVAAILKEQQDSGVPADEATTVVRQHRRKLPGEWKWLRIKVGADEIRGWKRIARRNGTSMQAVALTAIRAAFEGMG